MLSSFFAKYVHPQSWYTNVWHTDELKLIEISRHSNDKDKKNGQNDS